MYYRNQEKTFRQWLLVRQSTEPTVNEIHVSGKGIALQLVRGREVFIIHYLSR